MAGSAENALPNAFVPVETTAGRANAATQAPVASPGQQAQVGQPTPLLLADHQGRPVTARLVVAGPGDHAAAEDRAAIPPIWGGSRSTFASIMAARPPPCFTVDRPETLLLLQRDARTVTDMLTAAGFTVDQGDLGFTLRDNGGGWRSPANLA